MAFLTEHWLVLFKGSSTGYVVKEVGMCDGEMQQWARFQALLGYAVSLLFGGVACRCDAVSHQVAVPCHPLFRRLVHPGVQEGRSAIRSDASAGMEVHIGIFTVGARFAPRPLGDLDGTAIYNHIYLLNFSKKDWRCSVVSGLSVASSSGRSNHAVMSTSTNACTSGGTALDPHLTGTRAVAGTLSVASVRPVPVGQAPTRRGVTRTPIGPCVDCLPECSVSIPLEGELIFARFFVEVLGLLSPLGPSAGLAGSVNFFASVLKANTVTEAKWATTVVANEQYRSSWVTWWSGRGARCSSLGATGVPAVGSNNVIFSSGVHFTAEYRSFCDSSELQHLLPGGVRAALPRVVASPLLASSLLGAKFFFAL